MRYKNLRCGRNVVISCSNKNDFTYGKGVWLAEGVQLNIFNSKLSFADHVNICPSCQLSPGKTGIQIGKRSRLQENARLIGEIKIGNDVIIAPNFYMSSGIHVFNREPHLLVSLQDLKHEAYAEPCVIEDDVYIGMNVCVMPGVRIRRGCIIGAGAIVTRSTEPYTIYAGVPAKKIGTRYNLEAKDTLDATIPQNLPYFYQGFDHFNYAKHNELHEGIMTDDYDIKIYTELPRVERMSLRLKHLSTKNCRLRYNQRDYKIGPGINTIIIDNIQVMDKIIHLQSTDKIIVKLIEFIA